MDASRNCDVSPRGDAPGFVLILDEKTLVIPERPGNRRVDTLRNILQTSTVGLLFMIPGIEETLRVNGRGCLVRDTALLQLTAAQGKEPLIAIGVEVKECFLHCAKALKRSKLWDPTSWLERTTLPSLAQMLSDQTRSSNQTVEDLEAYIEESYTKRLY
jgi:PPOX class probable FMN-dependent enzyme